MLQLALRNLPSNAPRRCLNCQARSLSLCAALDTDELCDFEKLGQEARFNPKASLFSEDESAVKLYSLTQGVVRLYKLLPNGRRHIVGFALPGDLLGTTSHSCYSVSADAITPVIACRYSSETFSKFIEARPEMLRRMNEFGVRELNLAREQMLLLGSGSAEQRVATFIIGWRERLERISDIPEILPLPMRRRDIADFLGLTIETVSRTFARLDQKKIIKNVPRGIRILNDARMQAMAWA